MNKLKLIITFLLGAMLGTLLGIIFLNKNWINDNWVILEVFYYLSAPILVIISCAVFYQIYLVKKDMLSKNEKEIFLIAIKQCEKFKDEIIPKFDEKFLSLQNLNYYQVIKEEKRPESFTIRELEQEYFTKKEIQEFMKSELFKNLFSGAISILNSLEAFSMYFTKEIANEEIAYAPINDIFCELVESLYPFICIINSELDSKKFNNTIELYLIWKQRTEKITQEIEKARLEVQRQFEQAATSVEKAALEAQRQVEQAATSVEKAVPQLINSRKRKHK